MRRDMPHTRRQFAAAVPLAAALALFSTLPAWSQSPAAPPPSLAASTLDMTDVFVGRNVVGPYILSWRGIEAETVAITRGGTRLKPGADYKLDPKTGAITFTAPVRTRDIVRVDYRYAPSKAEKNAGSIIQPFQFNLFEKNNGALKFGAVIRPDALATAGASGTSPKSLMLLNFGGSARLADQSTLTSRLFLDAEGGNVLDRGGVQLQEKTKHRYGSFSAGFTRAGSGFRAEEESGIKAGRQLFEAAASLNPIQGIAASASFQQTTELPSEGKGGTVTVLGQKLAGRLGATTRFAAVRTETTTDSADGSSLTRTANRLQVDQAIGKSTSATAVVEHTETDNGDARTVLQTNTLNVRSAPTDNVTLTGTFQNRLQKSGAEDVANFRVEASPTNRVKLSALVGEKYSKAGALHSREARVEIAPAQGITLNGSLQMSAKAGNEATATGFSAAAKPLSFLEVSGGVRVREEVKQGVPDPEAPDTYDVKVAVGLPNSVLKLTGGIASNPEDERGAVIRSRNQSVGAQMKLGAFDVQGGYTLQDEYLATRLTATIDAKLGWRMAKSTSIVTTYRRSETLEENVLAADTFALSFVHRLGSIFDLSLSGTMTQYEKDGITQPTRDYRAEAKLGVRF
jgi:hypothetical protein